MQTYYVYAISVAGCVLATLILFAIMKYFRYLFLKKLIYPILIPRRYHNSITRFQILLLILYGIANGLCLLLPPLTANAARSRAGFMACFNMLPLFLGERTSVIANFFNIPLTSYFFAHHWIGRMAILHSFIHMLLAIASKGYDSRSIPSRTGIFATTTMLVIFASSIYPIRERVFEVFFRLHQFLALLVLGLTFWHLFPLGWEMCIYPTIALCLWILHMAYRYSRYNIGTRTHNFHITKYQRAVEVKVDLERRFQPKPGQFFYVQSGALQAYDKFQSHPFMVFWWEEDLAQTFPSTITFLIETKLGFTSRVANGAPHQRISLDGPHGQNIPAEKYDTVILAAKGIGIAGVLAYAQYLIWMKSRKRIRTRKVDIYWELEDNQQEVWVGHYFNKLEDQSSKLPDPLLQVWCYFKEKPATEPVTAFNETKTKQFYPNCDNYKDLSAAVGSVARNSPGRNIVIVCGDPEFVGNIRTKVLSKISKEKIIEFVEAEFRPSSEPPRHDQHINIELQQIANTSEISWPVQREDKSDRKAAIRPKRGVRPPLEGIPAEEVVSFV